MLAPLALLAVSLLWAGCGGDDDDDSDEAGDAATATATVVDAAIISSTLVPNEIVEADHYYADAVCSEYVRWARAQTPGDEDEPVDRAAALAGLVAGLEAIQAPDAYADVHETLLGLAREASVDDPGSIARLLGMRLTNDDRQERLQAAASDRQSCQRFLEIWGLPAFYGRVP